MRLTALATGVPITAGLPADMARTVAGRSATRCAPAPQMWNFTWGNSPAASIMGKSIRFGENPPM